MNKKLKFLKKLLATTSGLAAIASFITPSVSIAGALVKQTNGVVTPFQFNQAGHWSPAGSVLDGDHLKWNAAGNIQTSPLYSATVTLDINNNDRVINIMSSGNEIAGVINSGLDNTKGLILEIKGAQTELSQGNLNAVDFAEQSALGNYEIIKLVDFLGAKSGVITISTKNADLSNAFLSGDYVSNHGSGGFNPFDSRSGKIIVNATGVKLGEFHNDQERLILDLALNDNSSATLAKPVYLTNGIRIGDGSTLTAQDSILYPLWNMITLPPVEYNQLIQGTADNKGTLIIEKYSCS